MPSVVVFPDPRRADPHGLVAVGGDFAPRTLLTAYSQGIFPWPMPGMPYAWYSPNPRTILPPDELHVPRSLRKTIRRGRFRITFDTAFEEVVRRCAAVPRVHEDGTWIVDALAEGFCRLHELGFAHSAEAWLDDQLVGGLYGLSIGATFCGESMFYAAPDASKVAFVALAEQLQRWRFRLIDCQMKTHHLTRFGARDVPRDDYLKELEEALKFPTRRGPWTDLVDRPS